MESMSYRRVCLIKGMFYRWTCVTSEHVLWVDVFTKKWFVILEDMSLWMTCPV